MLIFHKGHTDTIQVYSVTVMIHVKALQAGHSSQGTSEPITPASSSHNTRINIYNGYMTFMWTTTWRTRPFIYGGITHGDLDIKHFNNHNFPLCYTDSRLFIDPPLYIAPTHPNQMISRLPKPIPEPDRPASSRTLLRLALYVNRL